ncbi:hypothetical protein OS493_013607 [Desmophyllum pertusum]|uniref:Uncharacterized protein n=1 Tax=Desmophyllum pertusum TaxID=174260 RepID=A0A9X0DA70_9CNID|nr:hypothetical protein OS493_013607 [Desmophyllum pertusum]
MADPSSVVSSGVQSSVTNGDGQIAEERETVGEERPVNIPRKSSVLKKDGRPSKRSLQKSVSFIARPEDKRIINEWLGANENPFQFTAVPEVLLFGRRLDGFALAALLQETRQSEKSTLPVIIEEEAWLPSRLEYLAFYLKEGSMVTS